MQKDPLTNEPSQEKESLPAQDKTHIPDIQPESEETPARGEPEQHTRAAFDWLATGLAIVIAGFFALTARFQSQPSPSFVPIAILSATGCGLLINAVRKLHTVRGIGAREALLGGLLLALFQFAVSLTYPGVVTTLATSSDQSHAYLTTWGLIGMCTLLLSLAGAALGHLAFAPLRPVPLRRAQAQDEEEEEEEEQPEFEKRTDREDIAPISDEQEGASSDDPAASPDTLGEEEEQVEAQENASGTAEPARSLVSYLIAITLIGLLPMLTGYVFAAIYDYIMGLIHADQISPALYPTLSLLSGLLPWRLAVPINLSGSNGNFIIFTLLWRIPDSFLGNPETFDVQALEPLLFNAAALAFFLITVYKRERESVQPQVAPSRIFLLFEALLGLIIIIPPALWIYRGLEGVLQMQSLVVSLPAIQLLNPLLLTLNLLTGPVFCILIGLIIKRQYYLWTRPREAGRTRE